MRVKFVMYLWVYQFKKNAENTSNCWDLYMVSGTSFSAELETLNFVKGFVFLCIILSNNTIKKDSKFAVFFDFYLAKLYLKESHYFSSNRSIVCCIVFSV